MFWSFPGNNNADINGIANSGIETFLGNPLRSLAREICQNSLDAAIDQHKPVEVEFYLSSFPINEVPDIEHLKDAMKQAEAFWSIQSANKARMFFQEANRTLLSPFLRVLRISDFNTTGLTGSDKEYNTPWCNLTKSSGASDKSGVSGGSFGIGKFAPFACSDIRTVFYNTVDIEGRSASQGIARIASFRKLNGEVTQGIGYCGNKENTPCFSQCFLEKGYTRKDRTGTDLFIIGFSRKYESWESQVIASILDGFFWAIHEGKLEITVQGQVISKSNLESFIVRYNTDLKEDADKYYKVATSGKTKWFNGFREDLGEVVLGLLIEEGLHRKVAMVRKTGMKIIDKANISRSIPFAGIFLVKGEQFNELLRSMENPQHNKWEEERAYNRVLAKDVKKWMYDFIVNSLSNIVQSESQSEIDPDVGEYLPSYENAMDSPHKIENLDTTIKEIEVQRKKTINTTHHKLLLSSGESLIESTSGESSRIDDSGTGNNSEDSIMDGLGFGNLQGDGLGYSKRDSSAMKTEVKPIQLRVLFAGNIGEYLLTFVPDADYDASNIDIFVSAETEKYKANIIKAKDIAYPNDELRVSLNRISGVRLQKGKKVKIAFSINTADIFPMEVVVYGVH